LFTSTQLNPHASLQEWGQVLIEVKYAPVTPADIYTVRLGGMYDEDSKEPPFVAGHDAVAVVAKVSTAACCEIEHAANSRVWMPPVAAEVEGQPAPAVPALVATVKDALAVVYAAAGDVQQRWWLVAAVLMQTTCNYPVPSRHDGSGSQ
jgi:hypothetical protein